MRKCGSLSNILLDDILLPPAKDMIDNVGEKSDVNVDMLHLDPLRVPATNIGFAMYLRMLQRRINK
jgi:hypothetical protein